MARFRPISVPSGSAPTGDVSPPRCFSTLIDRDAIVDPVVLAARLSALPDADPEPLRRAATLILKEALAHGRAEVERRLLVHPSRGLDAAAAQAWLVDQLLMQLAQLATTRLYPRPNPTAGERIVLVAVGGYGRGEMAPFSDVDIGFLTPDKPTAHTEQVIESMLYALWDLGLKVGHSSRSLSEMVREAKSDVTVRTALLEARYVWGDKALYAEAVDRFRAEVQADTARQFIADKLAERNERHRRMGDTRYVVEPNVKEGKGGLRDLHALFWIGKYVHDVQRAGQLVDVGLFTRAEYRRFHRADQFLWAVRCHLHVVARRPEDRLTFDLQPEIARRMRFADRPGKSNVERFMQLYFLQAKTVGDLTGLFLTHLEEENGRGARGWLERLTRLTPSRRQRRIDGFVVDRDRLALPDDRFFRDDPVRLVAIFALADRHRLNIHPLAMRAAARDAKLIDDYRADARANALFLDLLASPRDPAGGLRRMNEAGVLGRFVPDFGRIVAQMQFDMYHHYTVDEHTIHAIGLLSRIEKGELAADHPLASDVVPRIMSRRALYVAVLLHDIAKGRDGDHSVLGEAVALRLCPRFGLTEAETETVAWLVRHHLMMSEVAFKRDLSDFKTILDLRDVIQSIERLRLLLVLTTVDIRAVGPGTWNGWKGQLLGDLFRRTEEVLRLGHQQRGRSERIAAKQDRLQAALAPDETAFTALVRRLPDSYWIAEPADVLERNARLISDAGTASLSIGAEPYPGRGAALVTIYAADHPGLFYRIAGAIHLAGGSVIDARIHTTRDGMALDNFLVQDPWGRPFEEPQQLERMRVSIADALANRGHLADRLLAKAPPRPRAAAFPIAANVLIDNRASNRFTVVEVNARDRPALLNQLAYALFQARVTIHSAHIATYGERAVDTFYLTDLTGDKVDARSRLAALEAALLEAAGSGGP
ncbi:[protein-PII] uridylyltransferase [Sphingomonas bacterium]|uniref:[protein-PII] uridylyltransferase n=1 Tax=Sphingomonas bacterium TaxID=1895847 RepID=UPI001576AE06|nr:[protein-PII] uridylyltransferase [Sphingomonas bacterium]